MSIVQQEERANVRQSVNIAQNALASFLNQPINNISCNLLMGGSEQDKVIKCTYSHTDYIVKLFSNKKFGKNETAYTHLASDLGIGPKLYHARSDKSYIITEFAKGNTLVPKTANTPRVIKNIAKSLLLLHNSSAPLANKSDMFSRIDIKYKKLNCSGQLKNMLEQTLIYVKKIEEYLKNITVSYAPCHNDLNPGNIFVNGDQVTIIDWGDAALGNPYYDIAAFFVLNVIGQENEKLFFEQYNQELLNSQFQTCMNLYKQIVYFEFALNLLSGVQATKSELLHLQDITQSNNINYYLTLLAKQTAEIDGNFLYNMAIASLSQIDKNKI